VLSVRSQGVREVRRSARALVGDGQGLGQLARGRLSDGLWLDPAAAMAAAHAPPFSSSRPSWATSRE
jgi:hypothetical protein